MHKPYLETCVADYGRSFVLGHEIAIEAAILAATINPDVPGTQAVLQGVNRHSTVTHYQRPNMTHPQEGGTGGEVSEILFFSAKSKRRPSLIYSMQIIPVCLSIVARRKGVSATRRGGLNWTPISLLVGHPCKLFHTSLAAPYVTGAILVLKSQFPEMTTPQIHQILFDTAIDLGVPGVDPVFGHGALNLGEAMIPQGALMVELGEQVDQVTVPLATSFMTESPVTGGVLAEALSEAQVLITDAYDRGYFAKLGPRVMTGSSVDSPALQAGLAAAFNRSPHSDLANTGFDLRLDGFGPSHDVTRIAHMDPMMALISRTSETGFSMGIPIGKAILSMANVTSTDASAVSLGASLPFGEGHSLDVFLGRAQETDSILGAKAYGAFAGLESDTVYGRIETKFALSENMILNGSITVGRTSLRSNGIIAAGKLNAQSIALGLTFNNALMYGDQLSLALARPFAVSGGQMTLRGGTGISAAVAGQRTNRISLAETTVLLGKSARAPEVHLGYLPNLKTKRWASADFAFGGVARLDGSAKAAAARVALTFGF